VTTQVGYIR